MLTVNWLGLFYLRLKFGLVFFAYGGHRFGLFYLRFPPGRKLGLVLVAFFNRDWRYYSCDCPPIAQYPPNFPDGRLSCDSPPQGSPYMAPLSRFALLRCTACIVAVGQSQWLRKTSLDPPCGTIAATLPPPPKHGTVTATDPTFLQPEMLYPTVTQFYHCSTVFVVLLPFLHLGSRATLSLK